MSNAEMFLWDVYDGEENHVVGATSAVDALVVLAENWGTYILDNYLSKPGMQVTKVTPHEAQTSNFAAEDGDDGASTLWEEWISDPSRRLVGSFGPR